MIDVIGGIIIGIGVVGGVGVCMAFGAMLSGSKADRAKH